MLSGSLGRDCFLLFLTDFLINQEVVCIRASTVLDSHGISLTVNKNFSSFSAMSTLFSSSTDSGVLGI